MDQLQIDTRRSDLYPPIAIQQVFQQINSGYTDNNSNWRVYENPYTRGATSINGILLLGSQSITRQQTNPLNLTVGALDYSYSIASTNTLRIDMINHQMLKILETPTGKTINSSLLEAEEGHKLVLHSFEKLNDKRLKTLERRVQLASYDEIDEEEI